MIETVLGPIPAVDLGVTCMHDHLINDSSSLHRAGMPPAPDLETVNIQNLGYLRWNMLSSADNLRLDDPKLAATELGYAAQQGQRSVVECSSWGLGPRHAELPAISRDSGVTVVCAYGAYVPDTLPQWIASMSEAVLEQHLLEALTIAVPGTSFKAGMLGIMGTTAEFSRREQGMLGAASRAAGQVGATVSVRLDPDARLGLQVVEFMVAEGVPAERIVFTNGDEFMDVAYWSELAATGAVVEMCFGTEAVHVGRVDNPSDRERLRFYVDFLERHPNSRHVLGLSTWTKAQLVAHGGYGYAYLMARIIPELVDRGVDCARIDEMLVHEPRRLLARHEVKLGS